jgi:hypothetical protein
MLKRRVRIRVERLERGGASVGQAGTPGRSRIFSGKPSSLDTDVSGQQQVTAQPPRRGGDKRRAAQLAIRRLPAENLVLPFGQRP